MTAREVKKEAGKWANIGYKIFQVVASSVILLMLSSGSARGMRIINLPEEVDRNTKNIEKVVESLGRIEKKLDKNIAKQDKEAEFKRMLDSALVAEQQKAVKEGK